MIYEIKTKLKGGLTRASFSIFARQGKEHKQSRRNGYAEENDFRRRNR